MNDFILNIDGYEGPIELLLDLAKKQEVDLKHISILELADQYSNYVKNKIKTTNLTLVADYLVIASWLTYLKSRLLLPEKKNEEVPASTLAENLREQLIKLDEMRRAGVNILSRPQLDKDFFKNGLPKNTFVENKYTFDCTLYDLLRNIVDIDTRKKLKNFKLNLKKVCSVEEAMKNLKKFFELENNDWIPLESIIKNKETDNFIKKSYTASHFTASLELAKEGLINIRQHAPFAPIYIKKKSVKK
jgi:segregation and condensation protein A